MKEKQREAILAILKQHGYPNMDPRLVLQLLPQLWNALEEKNLTAGMNYNAFANIAVQQFTFAQLQAQMDSVHQRMRG